MQDLSRVRRLLVLLSLILAGEGIFCLPFVLPRVFRPTILDVLGLTNLQLGTAMSVFGIVATLSYVPGGLLADRFAPRRLLAIALWTTASAGLVYVRLPSPATLTWMYAFWGLSTIFLCWSPMLRATRELGAGVRSGRAFGLLDGGRGLVAALLASLTVAIFAGMLPADVEAATLAQRAAALQRVILIFAGVCFLAGVLAWFVVPEPRVAKRVHAPRVGLAARLAILRRPGLWVHGLIVICAYVGFKSMDDLSLFARDGFGMNDVEAASVGAFAMYVRPVAAVGAGLLGDRYGVARISRLGFGLLALVTAGLGAGLVPSSAPALFLVMVAATCTAVFSVRALYFALVDEGAVPWKATGTAIGFVSLVGFTPDIFFNPLMGYITDRTPGIEGHQHLFMVVAGFAVLGLIATIVFQRLSQQDQPARLPQAPA